MTKKVSKLSLKAFYESTPGEVPLEHRLPSKPGENAKVVDQVPLDKQFNDLSVNNKSSNGGYGPAYGSYGSERSYPAGNSNGYRAPHAALGGYNNGKFADGPQDYLSRGSSGSYSRAPDTFGRRSGEDFDDYLGHGFGSYGSDRYGKYDAMWDKRPDQNGYRVEHANGSRPNSRGEYHPPPPPLHDANQNWAQQPLHGPPQHPLSGYMQPQGASSYPGAPPHAGTLYNGVPPPPPPPRQHEQQPFTILKRPSGDAPVSAIHSNKAAPEGHAGQPHAEAPAANRSPATTAHSSSKQPHHAPTAAANGSSKEADMAAKKAAKRETEQQAAAAAAASGQAPAPAPAAPPVRNEWADKLATAALERMNRGLIKSSLLGEIAALPKTSDTPSANPEPAARVPSEQLEAANPPPPAAVAATATNGTDHGNILTAPYSTEQQAAAPAAPAPLSADSEGRPKLKLQPRSVPVAQEDVRKSVDDSWSSHSSFSNGTGLAGRPKLNLLPRSKATSGTNTDSEAEGGQAKGRSIFGAARPREEVLKERGLEVGSVDSDRYSDRLHDHIVRHSSGVTHGSRAASVASNGHGSEDGPDQWQTVATRGRVRSRGDPDGYNSSSSALLDDPLADPFFGSGAAAPPRPVPAARGFSSGYFDGSGPNSRGSYNDTYGSPAKSAGSFGFARRSDGLGGRGEEAEGDGAVFKRALPTRSNFY